MVKNTVKYKLIVFTVMLLLIISLSSVLARSVNEIVGPRDYNTYNPVDYTNDPLSINIDIDDNNYTIGEEMDITLTANQPCYVLLYAVHSNGDAAVILPSSFSDKNYLQADESYLVRDNQGRRLVQYGASGAEYLQAVASRHPINLNDYRQYLRESGHFLMITNPEAFLKTVLDDIQVGSRSYSYYDDYNKYSQMIGYIVGPHPTTSGGYYQVGYNNYEYGLDSVSYNIDR